tara:strand:- start:117 stop:494 length:378 start_codon:yes stop_codon:yes gene_type:complete
MAAGTLVSSGTSANIPSGSGSERLRRATIVGLNNDTQELLSGTAGHIYTILSIIFKDDQGASGTINIRVNNGTHDVYILGGQAHGSSETFIWNDKFVMEEDDDLDVTNTVDSGIWYVSYIDQDFT